MFLCAKLLPTSGASPMAVPAPPWFCYVAGHRAMLDGARAVADTAAGSRPREPGDPRPIGRLYRTGALRSRHVAVLLRHGRTMPSPDPDRPDKRRDLQDWQAGLACDDRALRARQIVA